MNSKNGNKWIYAIKFGDQLAFKQLFVQYYPRVKSFIVRMLNDEETAEDMAQEIFVRLWTNRKGLDMIDDIDSYLFRASQNSVYNYFRKELVRQKYLDRQSVAATADLFSNDIEAGIASNELEILIRCCVEKMPAQRKKVFKMSRYESMSNDMIAKHLNIKKKTVENHITTALAEIRKAIVTFF